MFLHTTWAYQEGRAGAAFVTSWRRRPSVVDMGRLGVQDFTPHTILGVPHVLAARLKALTPIPSPVGGANGGGAFVTAP